MFARNIIFFTSINKFSKLKSLASKRHTLNTMGTPFLMFIIEYDVFTRKGSAIRHVFHSTSRPGMRYTTKHYRVEHAVCRAHTINQYKSFTTEDTRKLLWWHLIDTFDLYKKRFQQICILYTLRFNRKIMFSCIFVC